MSDGQTKHHQDTSGETNQSPYQSPAALQSQRAATVGSRVVKTLILLGVVAAITLGVIGLLMPRRTGAVAPLQQRVLEFDDVDRSEEPMDWGGSSSPA